MAIIYKVKNKKRARVHGFLARRNSHTGRKLLARRRRKGRFRLVNV